MFQRFFIVCCYNNRQSRWMLRDKITGRYSDSYCLFLKQFFLGHHFYFTAIF
jgi:hypothetical protein